MEIPTVEQLSQAYWNVSGAAASAVTVSQERMTTAFNRTLVKRAGETSGGRIASARPDEEGDATWAQGYGDNTRMGLDVSRSDGSLSTDSLGLMVGHDRQLTPDTTIGFALGSGVAHLAVANQFGGRDRALQVGAYARQQMDAFYASGSISYSRYRMTTDRSLNAIQASYGADFDAHSLAGAAEVGYRLTEKSVALTPYAGVQVQRVSTPGYAEHAGGSRAAALTLDYQHRAVTYLRSELGLSLDKTVATSGAGSLAWHASMAWVHNHSNNPNLHASFNTLEGAGFGTAALAPSANLALVSAGADLHLSDRWLFGMNAYAEFGRDARTVAGSATLQYRW